MEMLSREKLLEAKLEHFDPLKYNRGFVYTLANTAIFLYDERDKMKAGIEKLREKWEGNKKADDKIVATGIHIAEVYDAKFSSDIIGDFINDLSSIGKGENGNLKI